MMVISNNYDFLIVVRTSIFSIPPTLFLQGKIGSHAWILHISQVKLLSDVVDFLSSFKIGARQLWK